MRLGVSVRIELTNAAHVCHMSLCALARSDTVVTAVILEPKSKPAEIESAIEKNGCYLVNVIHHVCQYNRMLVAARDIVGEDADPFDDTMAVIVAHLEARAAWQNHQFGMMSNQLVRVWSTPVIQDD